MRRTLAAVSTLLVLAASASAQTNAARMGNDVYARSHDYDLVHQVIELGDFDWDATSFEGKVTTTAIALRPSLDSIALDAGHLLEVTRAADAAGHELRIGRHGDSVVVHLPRPAGWRDTVRFTLEYHGKVDNGRGLTFIDADGRPHRPRQIWSQGEGENNRYWFPTYDFPNDKATWELIATVDGDMTAVSNGELVSDTRNADGTRTMHWSETKPSATYLVSLIVAPLAKVHDEWKGKPVDYYVYREDEPLARGLFHVTPDMIQVYSDLTGVDYPWEKYAQTTVADFFGGMENVSATTLVDWLPDATAYADRPWYQWILIPHELAHQWFGDLVTTEDWAHIWLNEGFAEFMPGQYWRVRAGDEVAEDYYLDDYDSYMNIERRRSMPVASMGSNNIYPKGALVLEMMRDYLGDTRFWAGIHRYLTDHAYDNATTDDLRQAILDATGENLDWFFDQWLYKTGYPVFKVTSDYDAAARTVTLVVEQTQVDTASADSTGLRFEVPKAFRMPVDVRVGTATGDVVAHDWIENRVDTITVTNVGSAPTYVVFDDGDHILKSLDFRQPTASLAAQLQHDGDLWNRRWVIDRLGERPDDAAALAALARAVTGADYYKTRQQAAGALAAFPAARAVPALQPALRDSSAQVRAEALKSLGHLGGTQAARLARQSFRADSSYAVRAAALIAIARADSAHVRPEIRTALGQASYRDIVRNAALDAIAGTGDASFIPDLERRLGEDVRMAYTLGSLASKGNDRAMGILTAALDDRRDYVRGWALAAISNRLDRAEALARLRAAEAGLSHEDTKAAVQRTIDRLEQRGG